MKIRNGFVSNSSSSSFVCQICGNSEGGYDMSYEDAGMAQCERGHEICRSHLKFDFNDFIGFDNLPEEEHNTRLVEFCDTHKLQIPSTPVEDLCFYDIARGYEFPKEWCPICNLGHISDSTVIRYISTKINTDDIVKEIKSNFKTLDDVNKFLKENTK